MRQVLEKGVIKHEHVIYENPELTDSEVRRLMVYFRLDTYKSLMSLLWALAGRKNY